MSTQSRTSKRPTHRVYAVTQRKNGDSNWQEIGAAWAHNDGQGFNLQVNYLPLNGADLVIRVPKDNTDDATATTDASNAGGV